MKLYSKRMASTENGAASGAETDVDVTADVKAVDVIDAKGDAADVLKDSQTSRIAELELELAEVRAKNETLQRSLDDALSEICVAGCIKESLVELERQNAARLDEVATLQHLLNETSEEARWDLDGL